MPAARSEPLMPSVCKSDPARLRQLTLQHRGSGATKVVEYLGMTGLPIRAHVYWPGAGDYYVSPRTGALVTDRGKPSSGQRGSWQLSDPDLEFVRQEHRLARQRGLR